MRDMFLNAIVATLLFACGGEESSAPAPNPIAAEAASPTAETVAPVLAEEPLPVVAPAEPESPQQRASREADEAVQEERYTDVCTYLVRYEAFSREVCAYLAARASGRPGNISGHTLERWLRSQRVRRASGRIVDVFDTPMGTTRYEVRIGGIAILQTTETSFTTTGGFSMWVQRQGTEEVIMISGSVRDIPLYMEWTLADDILDVVRRRGEEGQSLAQALLARLLDAWPIGYRHFDTEVPDAAEVAAQLESERARATAAASPSSETPEATPRNTERRMPGRPVREAASPGGSAAPPPTGRTRSPTHDPLAGLDGL